MMKQIKLLRTSQTQLISQFVDNTSLTMNASGREQVNYLVEILNKFKLASGLEINWAKSHAYWYSTNPKPNWLEDLGWQWAREGDLLKLLGTPFGLDLTTEDVDSFLLKRAIAKLTYWTSIHLSLSSRAITMNQVLLSSLWYFASFWSGSSKILVKI